MSKKALIIVDVQNDYFPGGKWVLEGMDAAMKNVCSLLEFSRGHGDLVVHVRHEAQSANAPFFVAGTPGAQIHASIKPLDTEVMILKHAPNSFHGTDLKVKLDEHGIEEVVICGAMSHVCIDSTTRAAVDLGYACTVINDACATRDVEFDGVAVPARQVHAALMAALGFSAAKVVSAQTHIGA